jgi:hypothetical protein
MISPKLKLTKLEIILITIIAVYLIDHNFNTFVKIRFVSIDMGSLLIAIATFSLACVAWLQLTKLNRISKADFLIRIDERFNKKDLLEAKMIIDTFYREVTKKKPNLDEVEIAELISDKIKKLGKDKKKQSSRNFVLLLNQLDFLETISYFANQGYVQIDELDELYGYTLIWYYNIFKNWITYRRIKYGKASYYCEFEEVIDKIKYNNVPKCNSQSKSS